MVLDYSKPCGFRAGVELELASLRWRGWNFVLEDNCEWITAKDSRLPLVEQLSSLAWMNRV
jgi:hypothetical protein